MKKLLIASFVGAIALSLASTARAQLILNEANAVGVTASNNYLQDGEVYEGYDYGILPHSGNNNDPFSGTPQGNPFPADVDSSTSGNQTTLPNGWDGTTGWARIQENGGDWIELVVTDDNADLRGYTLYWENIDAGLTVGEGPDDRGAIKFTNDAIWNNLRAGTIITISEDSSVDEIRDGYPSAPPFSFEHDTGHNYDLSTDTSFDPSTGDWHMHFHLDETVTNAGVSTQYFVADSDIKVDNDDWRMAIFDASNTALTPTVVESPGARSGLDLITGKVNDFVGESASNWGDNTDAGGVNNQEMVTYRGDPSLSGSLNADYEDVDFSTFGAPNLFNDAVESTLDGVQDFSVLRSWFVPFAPEDLNQDTFVDGLDLGILLGNWNTAVTPDLGELNGTPPVDGLDLGILLAAWNPPPAAATASVPEPAGLALLAIGLALVGVRRN